MTLIRFALTLVLSAFGWLMPPSAASALSEPPPVALHTYSDQHHAASLTRSAAERGPPAAYNHPTAVTAVDLGAHGTTASTDVPPLGPAAAFTALAPIVHAARAGAMTPARVPGDAGAMPAFSRTGVAANTASGAESALSGALLRTHLRQLEKYGQGGFRELEGGRFRYYGNLSPAAKEGEMAGRRLVREWDPATGYTRTWHETVDQAGNIRIVRPETGGPKTHYYFDEFGSYGGAW